MATDDGAAGVALPAAAAAFTRLSTAIGSPGDVVVDGLCAGERARSLVTALLAAVATGQPWDDAWFTDPRPGMSDDDVFAALLEAAAALMHLGAECAETDPLDFLRRAVDPDPQQ